MFKDQNVTFGDTTNNNGIHWENALKWAEEALICRDIYTQVFNFLFFNLKLKIIFYNLAFA